jgi:hypothetical protein
MTRKLGKVRVEGKQIKTPIYEVCQDVLPSTIQVYHLYERALRAFKRREFQTAEELVRYSLPSNASSSYFQID